jgi:hypothetical protein
MKYIFQFFGGMKMKMRLIGITAIMLLLIATPVFATVVSFGDSNNYWPTWGNGTYDDYHDVMGNPNITGGQAVIDNGYLKSITFEYSATNWGRLEPGNLFINVLNSQNDTVWDYDVNTMGAVGGSSLASGYYDLYRVNVDERKGVNNNKYLYSGHDNTAPWNSYNIRDNHPIGLKSNALGESIGSVYYSGWPGNTSPTAGKSYYDFTSSQETQGLYLGNKSFILGWETTCGNDVVYERVSVPEPGILMLLGSGLLAFAGMRKFVRK